MDINTKVSPSLHPAVIESIEGYNDETASHVADAVRAFTSAYTQLGKIHEFSEAIEPDTSLTDDAKLLNVADYAGSRMEAALRAMQNATDSLGKRIAHAEAELNAPLKATKATTGMTSEIRAHVKALPADERRAWFAEALESGDTASLEAVLAGPGYLSGLKQVEVDHYTRLYQEQQNPQMFRRLQVMKQASALLEERGSLVFTGAEKALGRGGFRKAQQVRERVTASQKKVAALKTEQEQGFLTARRFGVI